PRVCAGPGDGLAAVLGRAAHRRVGRQVGGGGAIGLIAAARQRLRVVTLLDAVWVGISAGRCPGPVGGLWEYRWRLLWSVRPARRAEHRASGRSTWSAGDARGNPFRDKETSFDFYLTIHR